MVFGLKALGHGGIGRWGARILGSLSTWVWRSEASASYGTRTSGHLGLRAVGHLEIEGFEYSGHGASGIQGMSVCWPRGIRALHIKSMNVSGAQCTRVIQPWGLQGHW